VINISNKNQKTYVTLTVIIVAFFGIYSLLLSKAATPAVSLEAKGGQLSGAASIFSDSTASAGQAVRFGSANASQYSFGLDESDGYWSTTSFIAAEQAAERGANTMQSFISWDYPSNPSYSLFPASHLLAFSNLNVTPEITWDPTTDGTSSVNQPDYQTATIAAGSQDAYINSFAKAVASYKQPVIIRFAHEMNGTWTSYSDYTNGNSPGDFINMWRHVHDVFVQDGATKVIWLWTPNITGSSNTPGTLASYYPGDAYVDEVGLDGYSYPTAGCNTIEQVFSNDITTIRSFTQKPLRLGEVGISSACTNKPQLISGMFSWLKGDSQVSGFTWWDRQDSSNDWRFESDPNSLAAFQAGLQSLSN
jgi:beta-mannanase